MSGRVYKLQCEDGHYYIGSTTQELKYRFFNHKTRAKYHPDRKIYKHINGQWDKVSILLIEETDRMKEREDECIRAALDDPLCLNDYVVIRTDEDMREYRKSQYEKHKHKYNTPEHKQKARERQLNWIHSWSDEKREQMKEYQKNYYANLTPEQKEERVAKNRERRRRGI